MVSTSLAYASCCRKNIRLMVVLMTVTNGCSQCIRSILLREILELQDHCNHLLNLILTRMTVPGHCLLDLDRIVFGHGDVPLRGRQQGNTANLAQLQRTLDVTSQEHLLDANGPWCIFTRHVVQSPENALEPQRLGVTRGGPDGSMGYVGQATAVEFDQTPSGFDGTRVYAKNRFDQVISPSYPVRFMGFL